MDIEEYIDKEIDSLSKIIIIEDALGLLSNGYPLDTETELQLESINIDPFEFTETYAKRSSGRLQVTTK